MKRGGKWTRRQQQEARARNPRLTAEDKRALVKAEENYRAAMVLRFREETR